MPRVAPKTLLATMPLLLVVGALHAQIARAGPHETDSRALRRTPAVEVFERWKDSVVFATGPVVPAGGSKLDEFFDLPGANKLEKSVGTGFVVHESGYIVTNAHAAERVVSHQVVLADGKKCSAELVATVHEEDVALLKIDAGRPLPAVKLARAGDLMIGEPVIVIANPHGLICTCTTGIVSAVGRQTNLLDVKGVTLRDMIQTDAGINPGSSGGPWFNVLGEVIGLTASMKKDSQNIGFAVSSASLRRLLPGMLDVERRYGFLTGLELSDQGPCRVSGVEPHSPAVEAGIQPGDLLVKVAQRPTPTILDFHLALIGRKPGETIRIELLRNEEPTQVSLTLAERPKPDGAALLRQKLGLTAEPLDGERIKAMSLRSRHGLVITEVDPEWYGDLDHQPAVGDVLARVHRIRPRNFDHLGLILDQVRPGQRVPMVLLRRDGDKATRVDIGLVLPTRPSDQPPAGNQPEGDPASPSRDGSEAYQQ